MTDLGHILLALVPLTVLVLVVISVVLALRPRRGVTQLAAQLGRAQWLTVAFGLVEAYLVAVAVKRYVQQNPFGMIVFVGLCVTTAAGGAWLWHVWRRYLHDRDEARWAAEQARAVQTPAQPNRSLSGQEKPPTRW